MVYTLINKPRNVVPVLRFRVIAGAEGLASKRAITSRLK